MQDIKDLKVNLGKMIQESDRIIIHPHKRADVDAIGSAYGISLIADKLRKDSHILIGDEISELHNGAQEMLKEIKEDRSIIGVEQFDSLNTGSSLNILSDVNKPDRTFIKSFDKKRLVIIDHHNADEQTFDAILPHIDTSASSASEIVAALIKEWRIKIPVLAANALLAGIRLDTNSSRNNVSDDTSAIETYLLKSGATVERAQEYIANSFDSDKEVRKLINKAILYQLLTARISLADEDVVLTPEQLSQAANELLQYESDATFAVGNIGNGTISVSARGKGNIDVGSVMKALQNEVQKTLGEEYKISGGGSPAMAGITIPKLSIEEVGDKLVKVLKPKFNIEKTS